MGGLAVADGIGSATGLQPALKWPNDLVVPDAASACRWRKLAGILAEAGTSLDGSAWVVLGVGINVRPAAHPAEVAARATSLEAELGRTVDRGLLLAECLVALRVQYEALCAGGRAALLAAWRARARATFGRAVEWDVPGGTDAGTIEDVDDDGALVVRTDAGTRRLISGEIRMK
jgi:BirA family biotin operon repressor/biotin-[acetyl-CoA-carboxylase] ligase